MRGITALSNWLNLDIVERIGLVGFLLDGLEGADTLTSLLSTMRNSLFFPQLRYRVGQDIDELNLDLGVNALITKRHCREHCKRLHH